MSAHSLIDINLAGWIARAYGTKRLTDVSLRRPVSPPSNGNGRSRVDHVALSELATIVADVRPEIMAHAQRTETLARRLAHAQGLPPSMVDTIATAALLHDIGKAYIPSAILDKPGKLTEEEWEQVKQHPDIAYQILRDIPGLEAILPIVRHHHERYDGTGYPAGLVGEAIPLGARILTVSDAIDAMGSERPYKRALSQAEIVKELRQQAGKQFDPVVVDVFLKQVLSPSVTVQPLLVGVSPANSAT